MTETIVIVGAGRVARALGRALRESGIGIAFVASRDGEHAREAADFIGAEAATFEQIAARATHLLIAVSDAAIEPVAVQLARGNVRVALHTSGNYGPETLRPLAEAGVACGSIHPLQTIADPAEGAKALRGVAFGICGDLQAVAWAETLVHALDGRALRIEAEARPLYHAAAVMASNYITVLLDAARTLMSHAGVPADIALEALAPLARASVENAVRLGPVSSLTGPIVRGDASTVEAHMRAFAESHVEESIVNLYEAAGIAALQIAKQRGLPDDILERLERALRGEDSSR